MRSPYANQWGTDWLDADDEDPNPEASASGYFGTLTPTEEAAAALEAETNAAEAA